MAVKVLRGGSQEEPSLHASGVVECLENCSVRTREEVNTYSRIVNLRADISGRFELRPGQPLQLSTGVRFRIPVGSIGFIRLKRVPFCVCGVELLDPPGYILPQDDQELVLTLYKVNTPYFPNKLDLAPDEPIAEVALHL